MLDDARLGRHHHDLNLVSVALLSTPSRAANRVPLFDEVRQRFETAMCQTLRALVDDLAEEAEPVLVAGLLEGAMERVLDRVDGLIPAREPPDGNVKGLPALARKLNRCYRTILEYERADMPRLP